MKLPFARIQQNMLHSADGILGGVVVLKRRGFFGAAASGALILQSTQSSHAQDVDTAELAARAGAELRLMTAFRDMERSLSEIDHLLTYGIVASTGGWGVLRFVDTTDFTNSYVLRGGIEEAQTVAARANAAIQRSANAAEAQKQRARQVLDHLETIFEATQRIADALTAEDLPTARQIYRDECQTAYEEALRDIQSATSEIDSQLGSTLRELRFG